MKFYENFEKIWIFFLIWDRSPGSLGPFWGAQAPPWGPPRGGGYSIRGGARNPEPWDIYINIYTLALGGPYGPPWAPKMGPGTPGIDLKSKKKF